MKLPKIDPDAMAFLKSTLFYEPECRSSCADLLASRFFEGFEEWFLPVRASVWSRAYAHLYLWRVRGGFCRVVVVVVFVVMVRCVTFRFRSN